MDLWIRSQDKEVLVKANALYVMDNQIWNEVPFYENHKKIGLTITGHNHRLANYKTKTRALEVLDEIQGILMPTYLISNISFNEGKKLQERLSYGTSIIQTREDSKIEQINGSIIYQMPKE